jgi:hypothetical protein
VKITHMQYDNLERAHTAGNITFCAAEDSWVLTSCLDLSGHVPVIIPLRLAIKQSVTARRPQIWFYLPFLFAELNLIFFLSV